MALMADGGRAYYVGRLMYGYSFALQRKFGFARHRARQCDRFYAVHLGRLVVGAAWLPKNARRPYITRKERRDGEARFREICAQMRKNNGAPNETMP